MIAPPCRFDDLGVGECTARATMMSPILGSRSKD
jgi:hypothetical protein